ncbi:MAG: YtxH domain-containing protein [Bacteroidales bacterium]|jgi:gas vesicle protein|nr:YtxH domain-containing protein [Bacteroidales bacterium]
MSTGNSLLCFIAGAMAGAVAAVLLAPDSGENTRAKIREEAESISNKAKNRIKKGLDAVETVLEEE